MKHLKLFFALFAMLALGVGNSWAEEYTIGWGSASGTNSQNFTAVSGEVSGVLSFTSAKNNSGTAPAYNSNNKELRLYYNAQGNGGSITLTPASGVTITGAVITTSTTPSVKYTVDGDTATSVSQTNKVYTISGISATKSLKIQNVNTSNTQLRIKTIKITYIKEVATGPTLSATPNKVDFGTKNIYLESEKEGDLEIDITGQNLTGDVSAAISGADASVFTLSKTTFTPNSGEVSEKLTVSYSVSDVKDYAATLTLSSNGVDNVELPITLKTVNKKPTIYTKVTDAATLSAGDKVIFVYETGKVAAGKLSSGYLASIDIAQAINTTTNPATVSITDEAVVEYTLGGTTGAWELISASGKLSEASANSSSSVNLALDKGTKWTISISSGNATIKGTTNTIKYNTSSPRFKTYSSGQTAIQLYAISVPKYAVNFIQPEGGELIIKNGETAITSGNTFAEGIKLTITATPANGYEGGTVVVKDADGNDVTATVYADGVLTMPAYAVTISATFEKKPCELLAKPTVSATTTYSSATLTWEAVANAAKYSVKVGTADAVETTETSYEVTGLNAETEYTYQIQAIAEAGQDTYCDSEVAEGTFTTATAPTATLTLSDIEGTTTKTGALNGTITLPTTAAECSKTFVGWDADENCNHAPTYAPGAEYTLAALTQTLYAVYADGEGGGNFTITKTMSEIVSANNYTVSSGNTVTCYTSLTLDENITLSTTGQANCGSFWSDPREWRLYQNKSGNAIVTATDGCTLTSVKFTFTISNTGVLLNNGTKMESNTAVTASGTSVTYTVGNSGTATNGQVRITAIEVSYSKEGEYSNFSTSCVEALDAPTFSPAGGTFTTEQNIILSATEGDIYYTLDGTEPTASSEKYTIPVVLDECGEHTIKAIAISSDSKSPVASATYTIQLPIEKGTEENPLSVADVLAIYNGGCYNGTDEVYVTGTVSSASYNTTYSNYTVTLTDNAFQFYRLVDENNLVTTNAMQAGDVLIAKGKLGEYQGKCQLIECVLVDYKAYEGVKIDISNNPDDPYTVEEAYTLIDDVNSDLAESNVYVKGIISKVDSYNSTYKSITYWISDDGTTTKQLQVYSGKNLNNTDFGSKNDLQVGDKVTVYGKLKKYNSTYELDVNNYLVSFERPEQAETVAALPFTFTGSLSDVENTDGMKQSGLGSYNTSLKLKFDDTGDYLTIHFDGEPGRLRYGIKGNPSNNVMTCIYKVQTSVDGTTYTDLETYTTLANTEKTMSHALNSDVRYVKFVFTEKKSGNVALGNITISQPAIVIGDGDNSSVIESAVAAGNPVDVIVNRGFTANDGYYTICVPFDMPASTIGTVYELGTITKHVSGEDGGININLTTVSTIKAGVPYLVLPNKTVSELLVENVTVVNTTGSSYEVSGAELKIIFTGIINGVGETTNGTTEYYVGNNGWLYNGTVDKLGLRSFFTITDLNGNPTRVRARVVAGENQATGIDNIVAPEGQAIKVIENGQLIIIRGGEKFNIQGQKL